MNRGGRGQRKGVSRGLSTEAARGAISCALYVPLFPEKSLKMARTCHVSRSGKSLETARHPCGTAQAKVQKREGIMAERGGFEPPHGVYPRGRFSKPLPSATRPPLHGRSLKGATLAVVSGAKGVLFSFTSGFPGRASGNLGRQRLSGAFPPPVPDMSRLKSPRGGGWWGRVVSHGDGGVEQWSRRARSTRSLERYSWARRRAARAWRK